MKFLLIAAGKGSRLLEDGVYASKPMVDINNEPLIDRLLKTFLRSGASDIRIICNPDATDCIDHLEELEQESGGILGLLLHHKVMETPSSMHSFAALADGLENENFVLSTADSFFDTRRFEAFVRSFHRFAAQGGDALMAVSHYIDDEKPLYVGVDDELNVTGYYDEQPAEPCRYVSAGIYALTPRCLEVLRKCLERGESRMRNFQRALIREGLKVKAYPMGKVIDIDHAKDIVEAYYFLREMEQESAADDVLLVGRSPRFSPNKQEADEAILKAVDQRLEDAGYLVRQIDEFYISSATRPRICLSMGRDVVTQVVLRRWEQQGTLVLNPQSTHALSDRSLLDEQLSAAGIPIPPAETGKGWWLKRADNYTQAPDDVVYCADEAARDAQRARFRERGISHWTESGHVEGNVVKFYAVANNFFHWVYTADAGLSKFGLEQPSEAHYPFDEQRLHHLVCRIGEATGLSIFGGDAVITPQGDIYIIDVNDFPSFAPCREEAADAIVALLKTAKNE